MPLKQRPLLNCSDYLLITEPPYINRRKICNGNGGDSLLTTNTDFNDIYHSKTRSILIQFVFTQNYTNGNIFKIEYSSEGDISLININLCLNLNYLLNQIKNCNLQKIVS